jgi:SdrD B-like domain
MIHRRSKLTTGLVALALSAVALPLTQQAASAAPAGTVGRLNLATSNFELAVGLQESTMGFASLTSPGVGPRSLKAISVKITGDKKATVSGACNGKDVTGPETAGCVTGLTDPNKLEGKDEIVSYDDVTGSVGGLAVIPASVATSGAVEIVTAPQTRAFGKGGALGPGGITTTDRAGNVLHSQWVNGVVAGPTCPGGNSPGDGSAPSFNGGTCATPLGTYGELYSQYSSTVNLNQLMVGIGDVELSPDAKSIIATNLHDGHLYTGPVGGEGALTKVDSLPSFAKTPDWRPYGLSSYGDLTIVTFTQIGPNQTTLSFGVASYSSTGVWKEMVAPMTGAELAEGGGLGVMSAAEVDAKGRLNVTFIPIYRQATEAFGVGISAPVMQLASNGVDHWSGNLASASRLTSYSIDKVDTPSYGRMANDQVTGRVAVTTADPLHFHSGGFTEYNTDGTNAGREQLTWRGIGDGGYQTDPPKTVDASKAATDTDLLVYDKSSPTPYWDAYAFGKMSGMGDLENLASQATIGNRAWADANNNGVQDAGEANIAGVALEVLDGAGAPIIDPATGVGAVVITDANGNWVLTLDAGTTVQVRVAANNWTEGPFATGGAYAGWNLTKPAQGSDVAVDSNGDPATRNLLGAAGQSFRAGTTDFSFDVGFAQVAAPPVPCIKLLTEVQDKDGKFLDANTAAGAAIVATDRANVVYRFTAANCGLEALNGVTITTGIPGTPTITVGDLAVGASSTPTEVTAAKEQLLTAATVTGKGVTSGTVVNAADPAQAVLVTQVLPNVLPTPLPATGSRSVPQLWLALGLVTVGLMAVGFSRRRKAI